MPAIIALPTLLRVRLSALRWRIRLLRLVSGFAMLVIVLGLLAAAAIAVDCFFGLPALVRQIIFSTWLVMAIAWLLRGVIVPLCQRIDVAALAAIIEEKYPELGERLSSAVELAVASTEGHGSPVLIALLLEETAARSEHLDFRSAVPARRAAVLAVLASATVMSTATTVLFLPRESSVLAQRFFLPWNASSAEPPASIAAPQGAKPVLPIELAADSPTITIIPPAYARSVKEQETFHGLVDLAPLQYSEVCFDFRFTRPAVAAYLEWFTTFPGRERQRAEEEILVLYPLALRADRLTASFTLPAIEGGEYRLILETEHDSRIELTGGSIHVQLDQPPSVRRFIGKEYMRSVLFNEYIPFEIEAVDDIGVAGIELEYRVNDGDAAQEPLILEAGNIPSALARRTLQLAGKVHEGDRFSYRFRIRDNLPKEYKGPHVFIYPPDRWQTVQIARRGDSLQEQEILAERDEINRRLQAIRESLLHEKQGVSHVLQEQPSQTSYLPDCLDRIQQLQRENRSNQKALGEVAQLAEASTGEAQALPLRPIAELAREVTDQEMYNSQRALDRVPQEEGPADQVRQLKEAEQQLASAAKRLEELKNMNDRLAQERLDRIKLEILAEREKQLAEKTADLAAKQPMLDPKRSEPAEKMMDEQAEVAGELERLAQRNELLKQALQLARAEQAQQLADQALELAQSQRNLTQSQANIERKLTVDRLAALARKQHQLAKQQAELARQTRTWAAQTALLNPENSQRAAEKLNHGEAAEAIRHQEQAAKELEHFAQAFDQAAKTPFDPKEQTARTQQLKEQSEQARQLADRQRELRDAVQRAAQTPGTERSMIGEDPIEELSRKQTELAKRIAQLARTIGKDQGEKAEISQQAQQAVQTATETARQIQTGTLSEARQGGEKTAEQLNQLAAQLAQTPSRNHWQGFDPLLMPHVLRRQQLEINRRLQLLEENSRALHAHQRTQQRYLEQEAGELSRKFQRLSQEAQSSPPKQSAMQKGAANSQQAQQAMQQARGQGQRNEESAEKKSQERAAQFLEQASQAASEAARSDEMSAKEGGTLRLDRSKASEAAVKAGQQMAQAQEQLRRGQAAQARAAMEQAARALAQTVQHMAAPPTLSQRPQGLPAQPTASGQQGGDSPDLSVYGTDNPVHVGKSWGELPSALRTKIVQDMKERYGEDYARMIKSYFEHIADTKK